MPSPRRIAIVLFNLGGPDAPAAVKPFLFNLFNDRNIIGLPQPMRWLVAKLISTRRAPVAAHVYAQMGGRSPILPNTQAQAAALHAALADTGEVRCFIAMRYWHPFTEDVARAVKDWEPTEIVLLPLYPQFSTTTTASSQRAWDETARKIGLGAPRRLICCYPDEPGFVAALADITRQALAACAGEAPGAEPAIIFSAHGLPKKIVDAGDPYVAQVEASVGAVARELGLASAQYRIAYQSRVGPLEWVGPATDATILAAARARRPIVVVPVAFVSEHSETLVELDIEYGKLAKANGAPAYVRAPTVSTHPAFVAGLARLVRAALNNEGAIQPGCTRAACTGHSQCALTRVGL
ncbi:ferrochelatase [Dongia sp.]|uniref:ferrochelatase n=1 Tax=Dongia sp. TaxID=1977262 RepID=UPI0035AFD4F8